MGRSWRRAVMLACVLPACGGPEEPGRAPVPWVAPSPTRPGLTAVQPLGEARGLDPRKVALGEALFHEPLLSGTGTVACATCHDLDAGGTDGLPRSIGAAERPVRRNAPTVFNAVLHFRQFWDGRAATLEEQLDGPVESPEEMDSSWPAIVRRLEASDYPAQFADVYGGPVSVAAIKNALATFERSLVTPGSRFDRFLAGDETALTQDERLGWDRFRSYGCVSCHQGVALGGNMFQVFGVFGNPYEERGGEVQDLGRYEVTKRTEDRHVFKVPSLRNVAVTAPYFHDGSTPTLEQAIRLMLRYQLGRAPQDEDVRVLAAFLHTLTGTWRGKALQ